MNPEDVPKNAAESVGSVLEVSGVLNYPGFEVDIDRGELRVEGRSVALRPKTFVLLTYFARHPGRLLARDELVQAVWRDVIVTDDSLVQCISELRSALCDQQQRVIRTVPRRGYILELRPVTPATPEVDATGSASLAPPATHRAPPQTGATPPDTRCAQCGFENADGVCFCEGCGARLARLCPNCGHKPSPRAQFCGACGAPLAPSPPAVHHTPSHLAERILAEQAALEVRGETAGERKIISVLVADLVDSLALIQGLDPGEARHPITPVIELMIAAVRSLGDGILALFGAPNTDEDHPQRASHAAAADGGCVAPPVRSRVPTQVLANRAYDHFGVDAQPDLRRNALRST